MTGQDEIQFTMKEAGRHRRRRRHLEVTMATVNILLGPRLTSHSRRSLGTIAWKRIPISYAGRSASLPDISRSLEHGERA